MLGAAALFAAVCFAAPPAEPADQLGPATRQAPATAPAGVVDLTITGVDGEQRTAVLAALEIAAYTTRKTIGSARLQRLLAEAPDEVRGALEVFGWYGATTQVSYTALAERRHLVALRIDRGEPVRVASLSLQIDGPADAAATVQRRIAEFRPTRGDVFDHRTYEAGKAAIERALRREGYFDAQLIEHRAEVSRAERSANIRLRWQSGERYRFGTTTFEGAQFSAEFMRRFRPWEDNEPYDQAQIEAMQQRLASAAYFSGIEIEPLLDQRADGRIPVRVAMSPGPRSAWTVGAYYETNYGAGLRVGWDRRWLNARGHSARVDLETAQALQEANFEYRIPHHNLHNAVWIAGIGLRNEDSDSVDGRSGLLRAGLLGTWQDWAGIASLNALRGNFRIGSRRRNDNDGRENATVVYPELAVSRVFARDRIRPRRGGSLRVTTRAASTALASDVDLLQIRAEGRYVLPLGDSARLLSRLELGWTDADPFDRLPPDLRFFAGGDGSVRGYAYQDLGPRDADGKGVGAPKVATATLEYECNFRPDWAWAVFVDGGNAFDGGGVTPEWGVGAGVRWASPIGPVRVDLAWGLDAERGGFQLHFSAGPDL